MSKVIADARSAVADLPEGATLLVGGFGLCGIPEELIQAVRELGRRQLTVVSNNAGTTLFGLVQLLLLGARLAQMHDALLTTLLDGRYVHRGRVGAGLTLHPWSLRGPRWRTGGGQPGR